MYIIYIYIYIMLENLNKKLIKKKWSVVFNTTCLNI